MNKYNAVKNSAFRNSGFRTYTVLLLVAISGFLLFSCTSPEEKAVKSADAAGDLPPQWTLVWADEFDYEGKPDPQKWGYDTGGHGWGNQELQFYTAGDNASVGDGVLTIEARREQNPEDFGGRNYTSTRLVSRNRGDWLYGRVEVRARIPVGLGTWPAIWMLPTDWVYGNWPASGEIDIMEHVGYEPGVVHASVHTDRFNHVKGTHISSQITLEDVAQEFHVYSVEWLPDGMKFFVDGREYHRFSPHVWVTDPGYREWPFNKRFHLLINIAVGGSWGGLRGIDPDSWPQTMEVDYVRVYQDIK